MDPAKMVLPGWNTSYFPEEIDGLIKAYQILGIEGLWVSLKYFVNEIMPVAIECDVNMCLQPDDPPVAGFRHTQDYYRRSCNRQIPRAV